MVGKPNVFWSDRLENLAEGLFKCWEASPDKDPFARICVVVGDVSTRNWIQSYFLLHRKPGARRILANIDFKPLAEFVNDWLAAMTSGNGNARRPSEHPYAQGVLAWRIDSILRRCADEPDFAVLKGYISGRGGRGGVVRRRFEFATRLAQMYDDYLGSRYKVLANWERALPDGEDRWQAALYRKLVKEAPETYVRDYEAVLAEDADPERAFANGFCRYASVHVFDVAVAQPAFLQLLRRIAVSIPVLFWAFNPSREYWLDDPTRRERRRDFARSLAAALEAGVPPPEPEEEALFETPDGKLLGALATGARGVLSAELDMDENGCAWLGDLQAPDFSALRGVAAEVHACHSPRRELEVARDALHRFFAENPSARPCDARVLCADWTTYAPLVESVFCTGADAIPVAMEGGLQTETPVTHSLQDLLAFRDNRFEVESVFALLAVPAIRTKFGIAPDGLTVLREMVRANNIHWGYDDADVRETLGLVDDSNVHTHTWRRGLDRFELDALLGPRTDERALVDAGAMGRLQPCGHVEAERAELVGKLDRFVSRLAQLRVFLRGEHTPDAWCTGLLGACDDFYSPGKDEQADVDALRRAIDAAAHAAEVAQRVSHEEGTAISGELMCRSVLADVKGGVRRMSSAGDAVLFAPLQIGSAVPAQFVWICGLSDGSFPRNAFRPSFDLIGRHPSLFDVGTRERDALSLLKAALGARMSLAFSYVGRSVRTNEVLPAAVPLNDLMDWFRASGLDLKVYQHPLQSYSARYFQFPEKPELALPPNYSSIDHDTAAALSSVSAGSPAEDGAITPFTLADRGETRIPVDDLASFYSRPNRFLAKKRLNLRLSKPGYDTLQSDDELVPVPPAELEQRIRLRGEVGPGAADEADRLAEEGLPFTAATLDQAVIDLAEGTADYRRRPLRYKKSENAGFGCTDMTIAQALIAYEDGAQPVAFHADIDVDGHSVVVDGSRCEILLDVEPAGQKAHVFFTSRYSKIYESMKIDAWIRHVAGHAAGGSFVTVLVCAKNDPARTFRPLQQKEAKDLLADFVRQALRPMAFDLQAARAGGAVDALPEGLAEVASKYEERIVSTQGR